MDGVTLTHSGGSVRLRLETPSVVELLRARARTETNRTLYTFLADGPAAESSLTYAELDQRARAIAGRLQAAGASRQRVLLVFPPGLDYIAAFFGCLYAEAVAVPVYPPRQNRNVERLRAIVYDAQPVIALTTQPILSQIGQYLDEAADMKALPWVATDSVESGWANQWKEPRVDGDTLAFLQYTSGSTAKPKGVMISHGNLLHNEQSIQEAFGQNERSVIVGWLPLFHDMGLIGNVLQPLYVGAQCILLSPMSFLQRPFRWLETISRYKGTTSGGPNFAYDFCVRKISEASREALDLSSWVIAFNGSERVRKETMDRFCAAFEPCGFRREAFFPCYGLAEATLFVSGGPAAGRPNVQSFRRTSLEQNSVEVQTTAASDVSSDVRSLVSCGDAARDQQIRIVDPELLKECSPDRVGEIWIAGPNTAHGYWNRPEETNHAFHAHLADTGEGPFLRTGDLGFVAGGQLFITGRLKDLIIIRGRNCYPEDIEQTVGQCDSTLRPGEGAAFSVDVSGDERLVIVHEVTKEAQRNNLATAVENIRRVVAEEYDLQLYAVALIKPGSLLKTSSGKIQRQATKKAFQKGKLDTLLRWELGAAREDKATASSSAASFAVTAEWIANKLADLLGLTRERIDLSVSITRYGLDSLAAIELAHSIEENFGATIPVLTLIENISVSELAALVLEELARSAGAPASGTRAVTSPSFPLSHGQSALWFLHRLAPQSVAYNVNGVARVVGPLDVAALRLAFQNLLERHVELRVRFAASNGEPVQVAQDDLAVSFSKEDASNYTDDKLRRRLHEEAHRPFDLENGPVFRVRLFGGVRGEHLLLIAAHHIVVDMWSMAVLVRELGVFYQAAIAGARVELPALEPGYEDYVRSQQRMLDGPRGAQLLEYWRGELRDELPVLALNADHPRPSVQSYDGKSQSLTLDEETVARLRDLAGDNLTTLSTVLLAAYLALLHRHTGQEDLIVGVPTSGRTDRRYQSIVGYFVNPIPIRVAVNGLLTFRQFLAQVREKAHKGFEHQEYPFALLINNLCPERDLSRSPVFQTSYVFEQVPASSDPSLAAFVVSQDGVRLDLGSLALESVKLEQEIAQFDLSLLVAPLKSGLTLSLQYNTNLFDDATIGRMLGHLQLLIDQVVKHPESRLSEIQILRETEARQVVVEFNDTKQDYPQNDYLHQLFEEQVEKTPDAIGLISDGAQLSYRQLNESANRLAHYLRSLGVGPETRVAILLDRSPEMLIGLLAVLKAGGCYLPLDPAYPFNRVSFMLEDASVPVIISRQALAEHLQLHTTTLVNLDRDAASIAQQDCTNPSAWTTAGNLSHIIYTSGSTGQPKGVAIEHRSVINFLHWAHQTFSREQLARVVASTSICFDLSVFEIFAPLTCGGAVILTDNALHLATHEAANSATLINTVPSAMAELLRMRAVGKSVTTINLAGEPLQNKLVQQIYSETDVARVLNLYGPTEYTTYTTGIEMQAGSEMQPTIGCAIANTQVYIVDDQSRPAPIGVVGEVYIGGQGLARCYWNRPELTAERFIPDSVSGAAGTRLYRTSDLGRYLANGEIEYLGRKDHQVKIRGYRIELGEIEVTLLRYPGVKEAAVISRGDPLGEKQIVAYVVAEPSQPVSSHELRNYLRQTLPAFMVPQLFVTLESMPLTSNGKVDRRALSAQRLPELLTMRERTGLRSPLEELIAAIWAEVLGLSDVGNSDNFFDIGGHSLKAVQVVSRVADRLQIELPVSVLFQAPTVQELAGVVEQSLTHEHTVARIPFKRVTRSGEVQASFGQERLWFLQRLEPEGATYNISLRVELSGRVNIVVLEQSLGEIVRRHEALRTTFAEREGRVVQVIGAAPLPPVPVIDLRGLSERLSGREREAQRERIRAAEAGRAFDLEHGPLLRVRLVRWSEQKSELLLSLHHIIGDGWSLAVLRQEWETLYASYAAGQPSELAELSLQYADYAQWQREQMQGEVLAGQLGYWREQLTGLTPVLELPTDRPRQAVSGSAGGRLRLELPASLVGELQELGRCEGATLYMVLLSGFYSLLWRYTQQGDVCVGTAVANRTQRESEGLLGFFVNTLALRAQLSGELRFRDLLRQVRELTLGAYAHQEVPFEQVVEAVQPERTGAHEPLFQVVFSYESGAAAELVLGGERLRVAEVATETAKFDLTLLLRETVAGVTGEFEYRRELYEAASIAQLAAHYVALLRGAAADVTQQLWQLPLQGAGEVARLQSWSEGSWAYPRERSVSELFAEQAVRRPDAIAVVYEGAHLSYGELNRRANQLAHYLRAAGVAAESRVALLLERSLEVVLGMLGVLKAGGVYVPLDPGYPAARLEFMLADTEPVLVLTTAGLQERLPESNRVPVLCLDTEWEQCASAAPTEPGLTIPAQQLAYVMYTSGSTGVPKGVAVTQEGIVRLVCAGGYVELDEAEVLLQYAPLTFDAATFEVWGSLLNGGRLALMKAGAVSLQELGATLVREQVSTLWLTASVFHLMVQEQLAELGGVRQLLAGGDVLGAGDVRRLLAEHEQNLVINGYGPTEATTFTCCRPVRAGEELGRSIAIGRPIAGTQVYVLDQQSGAVPVGVAGELYIGGVGLARGYWRRAELTAERFVPHFAAGGRLYRTGDRVKWLRSGEVEFLGRIDQQVKIRGHRIELGEVEAVLALHPAVHDVTVIARHDDETGKRLIAYVVPEAQVETSTAELREYLRAQLPQYMTPSAFVFLASLPLTANGKVNRDALPSPSSLEGDTDESYVAPRTEIEKLVAGIWCEVLKLEQIGINDNFFDFGGHSLKATQVISRVRSFFAVELPLSALFESPDLAAFSRQVEMARGAHPVSVEPLAKMKDRSGEVQASFGQERLWFLQRLEPEGATYNISLRVELSGRVNVGALEQSLGEIVRRHEAPRTTFAEREGRVVQVIGTGPLPPVPVIDLRGLSESEREEQRERIRAVEAGRAFDLEHGPLLRVRLVRWSEQESELLLSLHHIIGDGWSLGVLRQEWESLYASYAAGQPSELAELSLQYADYAQWQREQMQGEVLAGQLGYWREQLTGLTPVLELPTDRPRQAVSGSAGGRLRLELPASLVGELQELGRCEGATLYMVLLSGFYSLLWRYTQQGDVCVGTAVANRTQRESEGLLGFFVNTLALRAQLSGELRFRDLLRQMRELTLGAYAHQEVPFEQVVEAVQPERTGAHEPLFQVVFSYESGAAAELVLGGERLRVAEVATETAKFDLTLLLRETVAGVTGEFEYRRELYEAASIAQLAAHYVALLRAAAADVTQQLWQLPLQGAGEVARLRSWSEGSGAYPRERSVSELFAEQAARRPDATAVVYEGAHLSYGELNRRANQLAHYLRAAGVAAESRVALLLERSLEVVLGMLGVLKAGGVYVPLDPGYPAARLEFMLADTEPVLVLTTAGLQERLPESNRVPVLCLDTEWEQCAGAAPTEPGLTIPAQQLAYVMYTSGSTGVPKGVAVTQEGIVRLVCAGGYVELDEQEVLLQYAPLTFDAATFEVWGSLLNGGRLALMKAGAASLQELGATLVREQVSTLWLTASVFHLMVQEQLAELGGVRQLLAGGDVLGAGDVRRLLAEHEQNLVINGYGPTEATTFTCCRPVRAGEELGRSIAIGRPIAGTQVYVLDQQSGAVPVGVAGELYIGGVGLARGYWRRAELTAERFVPHFAAGGRLYRTGDRVKWLRSGEVEFLGRIDQQVKIRGHRIELGEVEAVLALHPGVMAAAVVAKQDDSGRKYLVGYMAGDGAYSTGEVRAYLQSKLPNYMTPAILMWLDELHLTPHGKIDRKNLPEPVREESTESYVAPRTPAERSLTEIWEDVLKVQQIGIHDNFFDLGGDSIQIIHIVARARSAGLILAPQQFFHWQTIAELALVAENSEDGHDVKPQTPLSLTSDIPLPSSMDQENVEDVYDLTPFQQGMLYHVLDSPDAGVYLAQQRYTLSGEIDVAAFESAFRSVMDRHSITRTAFLLEAESRPLQVVYRNVNLPWTTFDWTDLSPLEQAEQLDQLLKMDGNREFDLASPPLMRVTLVQRERNLYEFIWTFHLLLMDGWSVPIIFKDLLAYYRGIRTGSAVALDRPILYRDYINWLQRQDQDEAKTHWQQTLKGFTTPTSLGFDRMPLNGAARQGYDERSRPLDETATTALRAFAARHKLTLNTVIQGAWALVLSRRSGTDDVVFGSVVSGRTANFPGVDSVVGVFVNALPVRARISDGPLAPWLKELQEQQAEARRFEYTSLTSIQGWSDVPRGQPLFDSALVFQNIPTDIGLESEGVRVVSVKSTERSNLPLALVVEPGAQTLFRIIYQRSRFDHLTIDRILDNLHRTLTEIATNTGATLSSFSLNAEAERKQLINSFTQTLAGF